ncbi:MAG: hypothetical protein E7207_03260 [Clostridium butyricum]|nr:hypothetical protein [Clostridium butyricum]
MKRITKNLQMRKKLELGGKKNYYEYAQQYKIIMESAKKVIKAPCIDSSIECYCGYNYEQINEYLRFDKKNDLYIYMEMADILAILLSMAPRIPENIVVYRLVCDEFINQLIANNRDGIPLLEKGFISTSLLKDIIKSEESYSRYKNLLKIYVKKGTIGIYVNEITTRAEEEILLYPNGYFKLLRKPYQYKDKNVYECELFYF